MDTFDGAVLEPCDGGGYFVPEAEERRKVGHGVRGGEGKNCVFFASQSEKRARKMLIQAIQRVNAAYLPGGLKEYTATVGVPKEKVGVGRGNRG